MDPVAGSDDEPLPVYLVHYNAPDWLSGAVGTLFRSDIPVALHVIDNGPAESLSRLDPRVDVQPMRKNIGYAGGANVALRHWLAGSAPFCVIGSHDLHVDPDCLSQLLAAAREAPAFGILAPVVPTNFRGPTTGVLGVIEVTDMVSGTCMLLRRRCIEEIGLFDRVFHSYCEDNELCARAIRHGWAVGTVTTAHAHGLGTKHQERRARGKQKNRLLLAWRVGGRTAVTAEYWQCLRSLAAAVVRRRSNLPGAIVALTIGSARLARGMLTGPQAPVIRGGSASRPRRPRPPAGRGRSGRRPE